MFVNKSALKTGDRPYRINFTICLAFILGKQPYKPLLNPQSILQFESQPALKMGDKLYQH